MYENNEEQSELRGEKVPYQPTPVPAEPISPVKPVPPVAPMEPVKPVQPMAPKEIHKPDYESMPDQKWEEHYYKKTEHYHILKTLHKSMFASERLTQILVSGVTVEHRRRQIQLLYECTDVCGTTIRCITRNSPFCGRMAKMCARVCRTYYHECANYTDNESQMTLKILRKCAKECRNFAQNY